MKVLNEIIDKFSDKTIAVIGDAMLDEYIFGDSDRISPEAPIPILDVSGEGIRLGGAANVAQGLVSLGAKVKFVGVVGIDDTAGAVEEAMTACGIGVEGLISDPNRRTTRKTRIIARNQQMIRVDRETRVNLSESTEKMVMERCQDAIKGADAVLLSDYAKGFFSAKIIDVISSGASSMGIPVFADPKPKNIRHFRGMTVITPNKIEAEAVTNIKIEDDQDLQQVADKLISILKCETLLITLGEDGMALRERDKKLIKIPSLAKEVFDVAGAGDTVISVFTLAKTCGASYFQAATLANYAASISVGEVGVVSVSRKQIKDLIAQ